MNVLPFSPRPLLTALLLTVWLTCAAFPAQAAPPTERLTGHVPRAALAHARLLNRVGGSERVGLALTLPLRDPAGLSDLLRRLYTPGDPRQGKFLTPDEFTEKFGPTQADYDAVAAFARQRGLTVTATHSNRLLLDVAGTARQVEAAFGLHLNRYRSRTGRIFRAPDAEPAVPASLAGRLAGVVGLDTAALRRPHLKPGLARPSLGSGPEGGLAPADVQKVYSVAGVGATGLGQSVALFELDGYNPADIAAYASAFSLPPPPLQTVSVDGASSAIQSSDGGAEVTLDIELALAAAPGVSRILVYETPNEDTSILDGYSRIATDDLAKQAGTTWGGPEAQSSSALVDGENRIFQQMAAQGQSIFTAGGDNGAYDDGATLSVDDPSSQPFVTAIGGTSLTLGPGGGYGSETVWSDTTDTSTSPFGAGSGGGVSVVWPVPSYQSGLLPAPSGRSVPDVALDADPNTGYSIYYKSAWQVYGGTSAAVPFWAGLTARVNQARAAQGLGSAGFLNPAIYQIGASAEYAADFHDITTGDNLYYPAKPGYDNATGWGTPIVSALLNSLVNGLPTTAPGTVTGVVTTADTNTPVYDATVTAATHGGGALEATATTDSAGNYVLSAPSGLPLDIAVRAYTATQGYYAGAVGSVTLTPGQTAPLSFALRRTQAFAAGIQMLSSPYDYSTVGDFAFLFGLTPPLQNSMPRLTRWNPDLNSYLFYPAAEASTLEPGQGYWARFPAAAYLHFDGVPVSASQPYTLSLPAGWNQIGDPFPTAVSVSALTVNGVPLPSSPLVQSTLYRYDPAAGAYVGLSPATDSLQPYAGYWLYASQPVTLAFPPPG